MVDDSASWRSLIIVSTTLMALHGDVCAKDADVGLEFKIKDPVGLKTSFTYLNGWIEINCTYSGACSDAELNLKDKEDIVQNAAGRYKLWLNDSRSIGRDTFCQSQDCNKQSPILRVKVLICNPHKQKPKYCTPGTFCMIDGGAEKCKPLNRDDCLLMPPDSQPKSWLSEQYDVGCMNGKDTWVTKYGLCSSYKDDHFADYMTTSFVCLKQLNFTLAVNNKTLRQLSTVFVDTASEGGTFKVMIKIMLVSHYFREIGCFMFGDKGWTWETAKVGASDRSTIEVPIAKLAKYGGPILKAGCAAGRSGLNIAVRFYINLWDSSKDVKVDINDIYEDEGSAMMTKRRARRLSGLLCTVSTEPGFSAIVHWEGQTVDPLAKGRNQSAKLVLTAIENTKDRKYRCKYQLYGKNLPPFNDWQEIFRDTKKSRVVRAHEITGEEKPPEIPSAKPTEIPTAKPIEMATTTRSTTEIQRRTSTEIQRKTSTEIQRSTSTEVQGESSTSTEIPGEKPTPTEIPIQTSTEIPIQTSTEIPTAKSTEIPIETSTETSEVIPAETSEVIPAGITATKPTEIPDKKQAEVPAKKSSGISTMAIVAITVLVIVVVIIVVVVICLRYRATASSV